MVPFFVEAWTASNFPMANANKYELMTGVGSKHTSVHPTSVSVRPAARSASSMVRRREDSTGMLLSACRSEGITSVRENVALRAGSSQLHNRNQET